MFPELSFKGFVTILIHYQLRLYQPGQIGGGIRQRMNIFYLIQILNFNKF